MACRPYTKRGFPICCAGSRRQNRAVIPWPIRDVMILLRDAMPRSFAIHPSPTGRAEIERRALPDRVRDGLLDQFVDARDPDRLQHFRHVGGRRADMAVNEIGRIGASTSSGLGVIALIFRIEAPWARSGDQCPIGRFIHERFDLGRIGNLHLEEPFSHRVGVHQAWFVHDALIHVRYLAADRA